MIPALQTELHRIHSEQLQKLLGFQHIVELMNEAVSQHDSDDSDDQTDNLGWFMYDSYIVYACAAVRQMVDPNPDSVSLINLMEMVKKPENLPLLSEKLDFGLLMILLGVLEDIKRQVAVYDEALELGDCQAEMKLKVAFDESKIMRPKVVRRLLKELLQTKGSR